MIGYLDRSGDVQNQRYRAAWILTDDDGNKVASGLMSDPFTSDPQNNGAPNSCIGDYTDMWFWD